MITISWETRIPRGNAGGIMKHIRSLSIGLFLAGTTLLLMNCEQKSSITQSSIAMQLPSMDVSYYQLRIEIQTTSDVATLELENYENALVTYPISITGEEVGFFLNTAEAKVTKRNGDQATLIFDLALDPEILNDPLQYSLQTSSETTEVIIHDITSSGSNNILEVGEPGHFELDLQDKINHGPFQTEIPEMNLPKTIWAVYYIWYSDAYWASYQYNDQPSMGFYRSDDPQTLVSHINQAKDAGIDGFLASWWGPGSYTDQNLGLLLDVAAEKDFKVGVYFETTATGNDLSQIYGWSQYILSEYASHPAYAMVNGKPMIVYYGSNAMGLDEWSQIFDMLHDMGMDLTPIYTGYNNQSLSVFDGLHKYIVCNVPDLPETISLISKDVKYYPLLSDGSPKIWIPTAMPGFDERLIPGRQGFFQDRNNGEYYNYTFDLALESDPDMVFITSWNEWPEHSYIEPSQLYGDQYLQITREFAEEWKGE